jgi:hypothetical protein
MIYTDRLELYHLLMQPRLVEWERSPYSQDVLNMILRRHTDGILHGLITSILPLTSPESRLEWVKDQEKQGVDLHRWHAIESRSWEVKRNGDLGDTLPENQDILNLFMDEKTIESSHRMLLKMRP